MIACTSGCAVSAQQLWQAGVCPIAIVNRFAGVLPMATLSTCTYVHTCTSLYKYTYRQIVKMHMHMCVRAYVFLCMYTLLHACACVCLCACCTAAYRHACTHLYRNTHARIYACTLYSKYIYIYIHIHSVHKGIYTSPYFRIYTYIRYIGVGGHSHSPAKGPDCVPACRFEPQAVFRACFNAFLTS